MKRDFVRWTEKTAGRAFYLWGEASFFIDFTQYFLLFFIGHRGLTAK